MHDNGKLVIPINGIIVSFLNVESEEEKDEAKLILMTLKSHNNLKLAWDISDSPHFLKEYFKEILVSMKH